MLSTPGWLCTINAEREFERNQERYEFLKWGQSAFSNFRVVPPATGIVHQVNLEYLAKVVWDDGTNLYPDSLVGTDSHTTMINGIGVVGWGVGGIEAEAVMVGQPIYMLIPEVVGFKLTGRLAEGATATDMVLAVTQMLREHGVVGKFVEFYGPGLADMPLANRATIANMAPEYGATMGFFPVDEQTLKYMRLTGRDEALIETVEQYYKDQGMWRDDVTTDRLLVEPRTRPEHGRTGLGRSEAPTGSDSPLRHEVPVGTRSRQHLPQEQPGLDRHRCGNGRRGGPVVELDAGPSGVAVSYDGADFELDHGDVIIAAITSCTNTSNPSVMVGAGTGGPQGPREGTERASRGSRRRWRPAPRW